MLLAYPFTTQSCYLQFNLTKYCFFVSSEHIIVVQLVEKKTSFCKTSSSNLTGGQIDRQTCLNGPTPPQVNAKCDVVMTLSVLAPGQTHTHTRQNLYILITARVARIPHYAGCNYLHRRAIAYLVVGLHQDLVVLAQRHEEHDGRHVLKAVDPLAPLRPLTSDIHHAANITPPMPHVLSFGFLKSSTTR